MNLKVLIEKFDLTSSKKKNQNFESYIIIQNTTEVFHDQKSCLFKETSQVVVKIFCPLSSLKSSSSHSWRSLSLSLWYVSSSYASSRSRTFDSSISKIVIFLISLAYYTYQKDDELYSYDLS